MLLLVHPDDTLTEQFPQRFAACKHSWLAQSCNIAISPVYVCCKSACSTRSACQRRPLSTAVSSKGHGETMWAIQSESSKQQQSLKRLTAHSCSRKKSSIRSEGLGRKDNSHQLQGAWRTQKLQSTTANSRNSDIGSLLKKTEALHKQLLGSAISEQPMQMPTMAPEASSSRQLQPGVTPNERRLIKLLKKALMEKDRWGWSVFGGHCLQHRHGMRCIEECVPYLQGQSASTADPIQRFKW